MRNSILPALAIGGFLLLPATAFAAVSITNQTSETHTVTFDHGAEEATHELAPDATIEEACPSGCGVRFGGHDYLAMDGETLAIQEGSTRPVPTGG